MLGKLIDKICNTLTNKIRKEIPEMDDERAEIINYGLQNLVGEVPKLFIIFGITYILGIWKLALLAFIITLPYRIVSGGFHLNTHLGCILGTSLIYCGNVYLSKYIIFEPVWVKYIVIALVWLFGIIMINLYAPADTENQPILSKKIRKRKKILSYIFLSIELIIAIIIKNQVISNIIIFAMLIQTLTITKIAYKLTKNKYGYEVYNT